jgi:hypothetical protein
VGRSASAFFQAHRCHAKSMDQPYSYTGTDYALSDAHWLAYGETLPRTLYDAVFGNRSVFARILLIASFRSPTTSRYESGLAASFQTPAVEEVLARLHLEVFRTWLMYTVRQQAADISICLKQRGEMTDVRQLMALGERSVPTGTKPMERELFLMELKIVQVLLSYDH